jgi:phosphatidylethanolamine/phosphatidyl-N-methylethanolamine N-methyltransferase
MLERAQDKIDRTGWRHVTLAQGDALNLQFADDSFDYVMAFHVVSVVPDARLSGATRVPPGGRIVVTNHFRSENHRVARLQHTIDPMTRRLGWTTSLYLRDILDPATLHVERQWKTSPRSLFTIMIARNTKGIEALAGASTSS